MTILHKWQHFFDLLLGMTEKELRARYKHTVFGFLWVIINPLLQMMVIGFIFPFFIKDPIPNYPFYLLTGLLVWNFFQLSLSKATPSIVYERSLIKKAKFPHMVIPLSIILSNLFHLILGLLLLLIPLVFLHIFTVSRLPYLILGLILLTIFTCGLSLLTSSLNVLFRDISFFIQAALIIWFYGTPIVYSIFVIPYSVIWLWRLNPMTSIIQLMQYSLVDFPAPGPAMLATNSLIISVILLLGIFSFQKLSKNFDDWV